MGQQRTERKRAEKAERREAKAAKKADNVVEQKKRRMGNGVLALMIFGVIAVMFAAVWGYNYSQKEASIQSYLKNNGGADVYENMTVGEDSTLSVTAKKNAMTITMDIESDEDGEQAEYYKGEDGSNYMKYIAAYYLGTIKPNVRGLSASADVVVNIAGKELTRVSITNSDVEGVLEENGTSLEDLQKDTAASSAATTTETE